MNQLPVEQPSQMRANDAGLEAAHAGEVYQLAQEGNETAVMIMEDAYEYLSSFIATLYGVLDPELFVLSGSVALKIPGFIEEIEKRAKEKVYDALKMQCEDCAKRRWEKIAV